MNFFKAVFIGLILTALCMGAIHHWVGFDISIDGDLVEPVLALGVVMTVFLFVMAIVGLVIAGILGSVVLFGIVVAAFVGGIVLFASALFSWPVLLGLVVLWLICRDKPRQRAYERY